MQKVTFYSYKPYLSLCIHRERGLFVEFNQDCEYTSSNPVEIQLLREYAEKTSNSYNITEAGGELGKEDLSRLYYEAEDKAIAEAEAREKARAEAKRKKAEEHDFYSMLRGSDKVYR